MEFRLVALESPYAGDVTENETYARLCMADCLKRGEAPYASHLFFTQEGLLDDTIKEEDLALILYTSGTTGHSKGVMLTHKNLASNTESIIEYLKLTSDDIIEIVLPFYYCYGFNAITFLFFQLYKQVI